MAYNAEQDKLITTIGTSKSGINVQIRTYNGGDPKVAIVSEGTNGRFRNIGRMTEEQLSEVLPLLCEAENFFAKDVEIANGPPYDAATATGMYDRDEG